MLPKPTPPPLPSVLVSLQESFLLEESHDGSLLSSFICICWTFLVAFLVLLFVAGCWFWWDGVFTSLFGGLNIVFGFGVRLIFIAFFRHCWTERNLWFLQLQSEAVKLSVWFPYRCILHYPRRCEFSGRVSSSSSSPQNFHALKIKQMLNEHQRSWRVKTPTCKQERGGISFSGLGDSCLVSSLGGESGMTENVNKNLSFFSFVDFSKKISDVGNRETRHLHRCCLVQAS